MKNSFLIIVTILLCAPLHAAQEIEAYSFNLGNHTEFFNNVQNDTSGGLRKIDFAPTIGAGLSIPLQSKVWRFMPEIDWVLPKTSDSGHIIKNIFLFRADFAYDPWNFLRLRVGTSIAVKNIHGRGGSTQMNNGNGNSTFYYPDENHSSINNTFDLGAEYLINKQWGIRLQTYIYSLFESQSRQYSYAFMGTYYWEKAKK